jgi:hypothetical protein
VIQSEPCKPDGRLQQAFYNGIYWTFHHFSCWRQRGLSAVSEKGGQRCPVRGLGSVWRVLWRSSVQGLVLGAVLAVLGASKVSGPVRVEPGTGVAVLGTTRARPRTSSDPRTGLTGPRTIWRRKGVVGRHGATDARGPFELGHRRHLLAGRQAGGVRILRPHG